MTMTFDREKRLRYLLEHDEPDVTPFAVPACFYVAVRKHPEAGELLSELAANLVRGIDQFDRGRGGAGMRFDPAWSSDTDTALYLAMFPLGDRYEPQRVSRVLAMLAELAAKARTDVAVTQDTDLRARIAAELASPIPRSVAARLVFPANA
jgi:hypothetical protein